MASSTRLAPTTPARSGLGRILTTDEFASVCAEVQLIDDLDALIDAGMLERFTDEHGVVRFRPIAMTEAA